jgi:hypothetical protein
VKAFGLRMLWLAVLALAVTVVYLIVRPLW